METSVCKEITRRRMTRFGVLFLAISSTLIFVVFVLDHDVEHQEKYHCLGSYVASLAYFPCWVVTAPLACNTMPILFSLS